MTNDLSQVVFGVQGVKAVVVTVMYLLPFVLLPANLYLIVHGSRRRRTTGSAAPFPRLLRIGSTCMLAAGLLYGCWDVSAAVGLAQGYADPGFRKALVECAVKNDLFLLAEMLVPAVMGYAGARVLSVNKADPIGSLGN